MSLETQTGGGDINLETSYVVENPDSYVVENPDSYVVENPDRSVWTS